MMLWLFALIYWLACVAAASTISFLRGYTAMYGLMLGFFGIAIPLIGPALAVGATERWTREEPETPIHPVRWPGAAV